AKASIAPPARWWLHRDGTVWMEGKMAADLAFS
ncbi:hypothetical protein A2U01_0091950, partial [Trifolium medium]|nr:hypothetical protein [Trifolium medium]